MTFTFNLPRFKFVSSFFFFLFLDRI
uniref:Uncharacterized protein n=1 Tax=Rhizophora mucronata TaxID=61149 RepID=A0A2P2LWL0_RHIMU